MDGNYDAYKDNLDDCWADGAGVVGDGVQPLCGEAVSYTHLTLPTNREV